jgi:hypothetical protein
MSTNAPMSPSFAVFNLHVNDAGALADQEFIRIFGQKRFNRHIKPHHDEGIMTILQAPATKYRTAWVCMVTALVNRNAKGAARYEPKVLIKP